jgi:hypothetical protein
MGRKNLEVGVTIRVLGKDLTKDEAEELYGALRTALGKQDTYLFPNYHRTYPAWPNQILYGDGMTTTCGNSVETPYQTSNMVEVLN